MRSNRGFAYILIPLLIVILFGVYFLSTNKTRNTTSLTPPILTTSPTPNLFPYKNPVIPKNGSYRIFIVGDSIANFIGSNSTMLREDLISHYPDSDFVIYNYGYPSTNILSLYERLTKNTYGNGAENPAVLGQVFELLIIESFGYNPLSEYPLAEGLKLQEEELERSVVAILTQKPNAALAFLTPIALDPVNFAKSTRDLTPEVRRAWVEERVAYIDNHRKFAEEKGIPVIDVYRASLKPDGEVDRTYISDDFVHPSQKGIELMSRSIADYIFNNKVFPQ